MTSLSHVLNDIERAPWDSDERVQPQIEEMTLNVATSETSARNRCFQFSIELIFVVFCVLVLEDTLQTVTSAISNDRVSLKTQNKKSIDRNFLIFDSPIFSLYIHVYLIINMYKNGTK